MSKLSDDLLERSRKNNSIVLQQISRLKQTNIAREMGMSEGNLSKIISGDVPLIMELLAVLGFQIVPVDAHVIPHHEKWALMSLARNYLDAELQHRDEQKRQAELFEGK